ncbi:transporter [Sphingosinicella sp.]|uniref:transporter n=1 Tax=Sphingosinicella sp. TaxID=1917971 RepID=UPI00403803EA
MKRLAAASLALSMAGAAVAQDAPICTDRPARANAVCTVPSGRIQIETTVSGWSLTDAGGNRTELLTVASSVAKIGLTERSDVQIGITPFARLTNRRTGSIDQVSGFGDMLFRYKHRLTGDDAPVQVAVIPFITLPTARRGLGNDRVEGGLAVPVSFRFAGPVTMTLGPELDLLADADGSGRHLALVNLVNLSLPIAPRWTAAAELWTNKNFDPAGTAEQATADVALAYSISDDLQLDFGGNVGLTADTPDLELYAGLSFRF